jgi:predicted CXXCH cytochrome family protein
VYYLIRRQAASGESEVIDTEYQVDVLTIGGEDSDLRLPGLIGVLQVTALGGDRAKFNGRKLAPERDGKASVSGTLESGDQLTLDAYELEVIAAPPGFDLALRVSGEGAPMATGAGGLTIADRAWSIRRVSWVLALLVLVSCLLVPLVGVFSPALAPVLRDSVLPDDELWSTGPLAAAHRTAGVTTKCEACHKSPFVMVEDRACVFCHRASHEHVDVTQFDTQRFTGDSCASCHREHNEPAQLVQRNKSMCVDCHGDAAPWEKEGRDSMRSVTAFTTDHHPTFRLALLRPQGPNGAHGWAVERARPGASEIAESSMLKFNHEVHLDADKVQAQGSGEPLVCDSCHSLKDDGEHLEPVTMDDHCRSCHGLSFDIYEPDLELPHGDTRAAIVAMEAHFIREFTDPLLRKQRAAEKPRRVPGKRESATSCEGTGLECGRAEALKEAEYQFANTGCVTCHEVTDSGLTDINDRWRIHPVRLATDWYPNGRFNHNSHLALEETSGAKTCEICHEAQDSKVSTDILIPNQDNCLSCHAEGSSSAAVDCVSCHEFHRDQGTMSKAARLGTTEDHDSVPIGKGG